MKDRGADRASPQLPDQQDQQRRARCRARRAAVCPCCSQRSRASSRPTPAKHRRVNASRTRSGVWVARRCLAREQSLGCDVPSLRAAGRARKRSVSGCAKRRCRVLHPRRSGARSRSPRSRRRRPSRRASSRRRSQRPATARARATAPARDRHAGAAAATAVMRGRGVDGRCRPATTRRSPAQRLQQPAAPASPMTHARGRQDDHRRRASRRPASCARPRPRRCAARRGTRCRTPW